MRGGLALLATRRFARLLVAFLEFRIGCLADLSRRSGGHQSIINSRRDFD